MAFIGQLAALFLGLCVEGLVRVSMILTIVVALFWAFGAISFTTLLIYTGCVAVAALIWGYFVGWWPWASRQTDTNTAA